MGLLQSFLRQRKVITRTYLDGYANRIDVPDLPIVDPIASNRFTESYRIRTRPIEVVEVPESVIYYTSAAYNRSMVTASKINSNQAIDNYGLVVPKVNEESRVESDDYNLGYSDE